MRGSTRIIGIALLILSALTVGIWQAALAADHRGKLTVSFLDVGQGDAIYIEAPSGRQVLIDGGPDVSVLRALAKRIAWWDRSLDVVVSTSPSKDASVGLVDALSRFDVPLIVRSSVSGSDSYARALSDAIGKAEGKGAQVIAAERGQIIDLGGGAYIEILSPAKSGCVVSRLVYGKTAFMLPCDAPRAVENYLAYLDGNALHADVLKVGSQGSAKSSPLFVGYVSPAYAVISHDCDSEAAKATKDTLQKFGIEVLDTCEDGTITFVSDGAIASPR